MKTLFIYPEFPDTFWSLKHALKFIHKRSLMPPMGLLTVAALLPREWPKRLIDLNVRRLSRDDLEWADLVMISAMAVQRESATRVIRWCKQAGRTIVAGGPLFSSEPEQFPQVDHLVLGEAETALPHFLADLKNATAQHIYRADGFADLEQSPAPLWELADLSRYNSAGIQFSRGCPFNCDFCNVTSLFGHRPRVKATAQIIAELEALRQRRWRGSVFLVDDNLIGNKRRLKEDLLPALARWQKHRGPLSLHTQTSINLADDPELMRQMAQAGFDTVFVGIETPDDASLGECSKTQNKNRDLVADVKRIQRAGLQVQGGFIVGFDSDRPSIFQRQIDFIQKSGIVTAMVGILQALPGTRLYERLRSADRLTGQGTGDNVNGTTNIIPRMNRDALLKGYITILRSIYAPRQYYNRLRTFLREYRLPPIQTPLNFSRITAFARSLGRLGVIGKERFQFWKLLAWTAFRRPRLMPLAIQLAICGYHYRRICELYLT